MAKDRVDTPPVADPEKAALLVALQQMQARLDAMEQQVRVQQETLSNSRTRVIDAEYEAYKLEVARPAKDRTQDIADKKYGKDGKRFRCRLDASKSDNPTVNISEHPELVVSANSDLEAQARYLDLCGIRKHDYAVSVTPEAA